MNGTTAELQICYPSLPCYFVLGCEFVPLCPPMASLLDTDWVESPAGCPGGFTIIPGGLSLCIGVMAVPRCLCSYQRKIDLPLFFILHLILHFFFPPLFLDSPLHCPCPSLSLPRLPNNSPLLLPAHRFQPRYICTQIWRSCCLSNLSLVWLYHCYGHLGTGGCASPHTPKLPYGYVVHASGMLGTLHLR